MHDLIRQANYLRQTLAQDKKPLALFLGAGCPLGVDTAGRPLIPAIEGMTKQVFEAVRAGAEQENLEIVLDALAADGVATPDIEQVLTFVRALLQVAGSSEVRGVTGANLRRLDEALCAAVVTLTRVTLPNTDTPYHKVAAWVAATQRSEPVSIFTTNYDLLMEQALEENHVPYFDGFIGSRAAFFDPRAMDQDQLPARWARLWKVHGSINWRMEDAHVTRGGPDGQHVIYPSHLKYDESRRMPYLAMIDRLTAFLEQPSAALVTCGYSFGDIHLNDAIVQALQGNSTAITFALLHGPRSGYETVSSLAATRPNLSVLAADGGTIGTSNSAWSTQESGDSPSDTCAVTWTAAGSAHVPSFRLGGFAQFGAFVSEIIGNWEGVPSSAA